MLDYFDRRRQLKEREDAAIRAGRLPPGQSLTEKWPVLHVGAVPHFDPATWTFRLFGLVERERSLSWSEFTALSRREYRNDIHCVTRWSKLDNTWEGIAASTVLDLVGIDSSVQFVLVHAPDYSANLPLAALQAEEAFFALTHNGVPLSPEHGYPLRLVVPSRYLWKSVKWVTGLEFLAGDQPGFWEERGYHNEGDPFREERFG